MTYLSETLLYIIAGILAVTIIDTLGSVASRKLNFNYRWLTILSLCVYTFGGFFIPDLAMVFVANLVIGFYDATLGWKFSLMMKANTGVVSESPEIANVTARLNVMAVICFAFGSLGFFLGQ